MHTTGGRREAGEGYACRSTDNQVLDRSVERASPGHPRSRQDTPLLKFWSQLTIRSHQRVRAGTGCVDVRDRRGLVRDRGGGGGVPRCDADERLMQS